MKTYTSTDFNANFDNQDVNALNFHYTIFSNSDLPTVAYEVNDGHVSSVIVED
jgi:hypothetical protein